MVAASSAADGQTHRTPGASPPTGELSLLRSVARRIGCRWRFAVIRRGGVARNPQGPGGGDPGDDAEPCTRGVIESIPSGTLWQRSHLAKEERGCRWAPQRHWRSVAPGTSARFVTGLPAERSWNAWHAFLRDLPSLGGAVGWHHPLAVVRGPTRESGTRSSRSALASPAHSCRARPRGRDPGWARRCRPSAQRRRCEASPGHLSGATRPWQPSDTADAARGRFRHEPPQSAALSRGSIPTR